MRLPRTRHRRLRIDKIFVGIRPESPDEELYRGDVNPRLSARNRRLEILRQAAVAIEPSQGPIDDPAPRQQLKADSVSGAFDDLDGPLAEFGESFGQVGAVVDTVGEEMAQPGKQLVDGLDDQHGTIAILDIGGVHLGADQQTAGIGHNVSSRAGESHPHALPDPYVSLSAHTAPDVRPSTYSRRQWANRAGLAWTTRANHTLAPSVRDRSRLYLLRPQRTR